MAQAQVNRSPRAVPAVMAEAAGDKGHHRNEPIRGLAAADIRSCVSEPQRGRRRWRDDVARAAALAHRRRICRRRGRALQKKRAEHTDRSFAHGLEIGGLRRVQGGPLQVRAVGAAVRAHAVHEAVQAARAVAGRGAVP